ncbi:MAG: DUF309 domain-containing protein [Nitrospiria bacterium]
MQRLTEGARSWTPGEWRDLPAYLRGVDLFNRWYFWEAHEAWEGLWKAHAASSDPARFIQGLIGASAALLKLHLGNGGSARRLSQRVTARWSMCHSEIWMGIDVDGFRGDLERYLAPVDEGIIPRLGLQTPRILLID